MFWSTAILFPFLTEKGEEPLYININILTFGKVFSAFIFHFVYSLCPDYCGFSRKIIFAFRCNQIFFKKFYLYLFLLFLFQHPRIFLNRLFAKKILLFTQPSDMFMSSAISSYLYPVICIVIICAYLAGNILIAL